MESPAICDGMQNPWFGLRNQRPARVGVVMNVSQFYRFNTLKMMCVGSVLPMHSLPMETSAKINSHKHFERVETLLLELHWYVNVGFFRFKTSYVTENRLKYFELVVSLVVWVIAIFWFKNSVDDGFPYEQAGLVVGGLLPLVDSLRRFGIFSKVRLSIRNPGIHPWLFSGGKVEKTDINVELIVENNKETDLLIRSIEIHAPISVANAVGKNQNRIRLVDMEKIGNDAFLPIKIPSKSSKTILVESKHDASDIEKYTQASKIGRLKQTELFELYVTYSIGSSEKIASVNFPAETSQLLAVVRSKYEESGDHKGVVKLLDRT